MIKKSIFIFSVAGLLFAGYLSGIKFFSGSCALGESCPYFMGYPACYFGFIMYASLTVLSGLMLWKKIKLTQALSGITIVSFLGILFAGYFTLQELPVLFEQGLSAYVLGLPTCALGLIFYITIFKLSIFARFKKK